MTIVPSSPDMEQALLGSLFINPELALTVGLEPHDFYIHRNRWIYEAIRELVLAHQSVDSLTVVQRLDELGKLGEIGGPAYIAQLVMQTPTSLHAETYADTIKVMAARRRMIEVANALAVAAYDQDLAPEQAIAEARDSLTRFSTRAGGATHILEHHLTAKAEVERRAEADANLFSLHTGFVDVDRILGRMYPDDGTLLLLVGEPGQGKTILMQDITRFYSTQAPGVVYSSEMSSFRLMLRDYSARKGLLVSNLKRGQVEIAALDDLDAEYGKSRLFLDDRSNWTTNTLRADLARLKREVGIRWYAFDYLSLLQDEVRGEEHDRTRQISLRLMRINRDLKLHSVIIHTLTKTGQVAGSAGVGYDADIIAQLKQPKEYARGATYRPVDFYVTKNRDGEGPAGKCTLGLRHDRPQFITPADEKTNGQEERMPWYHK